LEQSLVIIAVLVCAIRPAKCRGKIAQAGGLLLVASAVVTGTVRAANHAEPPGEYQGPCALAVSKDGRTLYVAGADARQVAWVELPSGKVIRRIAVPAEPTGLTLTPDGRKLIVTCAAPRSTVAVFAANSGERLAAIQAGHTAMSPVLSPDGKRLYVCNRFTGDVSVIDLAAGKQLARVRAVREPIAAAVTPDGQAVFVANHLPNTRTDDAFRGDVSPVVTVIDARTHETTAIELPHGATGLRGLCITPDGKHALVMHLLSNFQKIPFRVDMGWINVNVVSIIDTRQRKVVRTLGMDEQDSGAGNPWDVACTADGKWVCASAAGTHQVCVIERAVLLSDSARTMSPMIVAWPIYPSLGASLWRRINLSGKGPRGLAVAGSRVFVAQYFSDSVAVVDPLTAGDAPVGTIALGRSPQLTQERRGELLFNDATICFQQWQSCASCHPDGRMDGLGWDLMNDGVGNPKSTKSMLLSHQTPPAMAEGVRMTAEEAVRSGIRHILFSYRPEEEAAAIDAYLKSLRPVPSPHLVDGRLSAAAERGRKLFSSRRIDCSQCHPAPLYADLSSHNVGSRSPNERSERFDTPTLIEVWRTAPYLHDGRYTTVKELLLEGKHGLRRGQHLSEQDLDDLVEFVLSL
jgi:YVTN family beta-propeller protein